MSIFIDGNKLKGCYLGTSRVKKIYLGTALVFSTGSTVDVNLCYGGTQYGHTYGSKIGTIKWQKNNEAWSGNVSDVYFAEDSGKFASGDTIRIKDVHAAPGFALESVTKNDSVISGSGGVYSVVIDADLMNINVNYKAQVSRSSSVPSHILVQGTNELQKSAWNVRFTFNASIDVLEAGVPFAKIPSEYCPATNKTINIDFYFVNGQPSGKANITIKTNGDVVSDQKSNGTGSAGGKWGGGSWKNEVNIATSWSVI